MAERFWPNRDPLGQKFRAGDPSSPWLTVVGVAADHLHHWFDRRDYPTFFVPYAQQPRLWIQYTLKTTPDPESLEPAVRQALAAIDPTQAAYEMMSLDRVRQEGAIGLTFAASVMTVLAGLALALAVSGIYGVMSYNVSTRTRDLGVRVALGATQLDVLRSTLGRVLGLAGIGLLLGLGLSILAGRALSSVLRDVAQLDASLALGAVGLLMLAATLASILPARRALLLDPVDVLRAE
jgi:ABC-type antimicrobial peptide transport system permease subunit